jgi:hypothetical protein
MFAIERIRPLGARIWKLTVRRENMESPRNAWTRMVRTVPEGARMNADWNRGAAFRPGTNTEHVLRQYMLKSNGSQYGCCLTNHHQSNSIHKSPSEKTPGPAKRDRGSVYCVLQRARGLSTCRPCRRPCRPEALQGPSPLSASRRSWLPWSATAPPPMPRSPAPYGQPSSGR